MTTTNFRLIAAIYLASIAALSQLDQVYGQASNNVKRESAIASKNKDNVSRRRKGVASSVKEEVDDEEEMEKIGEDIALLKLDDKVYWNRFLQSSGSMAKSPSAAPSMEDGDDDDDDDDDDDGECPEGGGSACDFEPTNRFNCGNNLQCPYRTICDLEAAGFDREDDCCQTVPENTACIQLFAPVICGDRECPYDNICFAEASGYDRAQCTRTDGSREFAEREGQDVSIADPVQSITEIVDGREDLSIFEAALTAADLVGELSMGTGPFTIFAPTNEAFKRLGANLDNLLKEENKVELTNALVYHTIAGEALLSDDLKDGESLEMAQGDEAVIKIKFGEIIKINSANIIEANIRATNGVIHIVDRVLLPEEAMADVLNYHSVVDLCHKPVAKFKSSGSSVMNYKMACDSEDFNENALEYCNMELRGIDGAAGRKVKDVCCTECGIAYSRAQAEANATIVLEDPDDLCHKPVVKFISGGSDGEEPIHHRMVCNSEDFKTNASEYCNMELRGADGAAGLKVKDVCCTECEIADGMR